MAETVQIRKIRSLGSGPDGEVFLTRHGAGDELGVFSELRPQPPPGEDAIRSFLAVQRECRAVEHPGVARQIAAGRTADGLFTLREYLEGDHLANRLKDRGPMLAREVIRLGCTLAEALAACHERTLLHGNLRPRSVFLVGPAETPEPRLVGFGTALLRPQTDACVPPECTGGGAYGERSEIFALGALLFETMTGRPPPPSLGESRAAAPSGRLGAVLRRCLAADPDERFQSMRELGAALRELSEPDAPAAAEPPARPQAAKAPVAPPPRPGPARVVVSAAEAPTEPPPARASRVAPARGPVAPPAAPAAAPPAPAAPENRPPPAAEPRPAARQPAAPADAPDWSSAVTEPPPARRVTLAIDPASAPPAPPPPSPPPPPLLDSNLFDRPPAAPPLELRPAIEVAAPQAADASPVAGTEGAGGTLGDYELLEELPLAPRTRRFLARHRRTHRPARVEVLRGRRGSDREQVQRALTAIHALALVDREHVVEVLEFVDEWARGRVWWAVEYPLGVGLDELARVEKPSVGELAGIARQAASGLAAAHAAGVAHGRLVASELMVAAGTAHAYQVDTLAGEQ